MISSIRIFLHNFNLAMAIEYVFCIYDIKANEQEWDILFNAQ